MSRETLATRLGAMLPSGPVGKRDHLVGFALLASYTVWLLATAHDLGFPRDEGFYFRAGTDYARWFELLFKRPAEAITQPAIDAIWQENHEHPSLLKSLFALSWLELHEKRHVFREASTAFRFPAMVMSSASLYLTYLFGARAYSRRAGLVGALLLGFMPHVFFHSHLACFDAPIMTMWLQCSYVHCPPRQPGRPRRALAAGGVLGPTPHRKTTPGDLPPAVFRPRP